MKRKFAVFDIDGTIFRSGLFREIVYVMLASGTAPASLQESFDTLEADWKNRRSSDAFFNYEHPLSESFNAALPHIRTADFDEAALSVFERMSDHVYTYTREFTKQLKEEGYFLIAISGSQMEIVEPFARKYGFDHWVGQVYERGEDGYFTGNVTKTHFGKDKLLKNIIDSYQLDVKDSVGVGDTKGDIAMLSMVERPIAFNPSRELFDTAKESGWPVVIERKNVVYRLERCGNTFVLA